MDKGVSEQPQPGGTGLNRQLGSFGPKHWTMLAGLALVFFQYLPRLLSLPGSDESMYYLEAYEVSRGALPYRDFFSHLLPFSFWFGGAVLSLLGPTVVGLRLVNWLLLGGTALMLANAARNYLAPWTRFLLIGFLWVVVINSCAYFSHHLLSGLLSTWAAIMITLNIHRPDSRWLILSGVFCGLTVLTTQHTGILLMGASSLYLFLSARIPGAGNSGGSQTTPRILLNFALPAFGVFLLALVLLAFQGILGDAYRDAFLWLLGGNYAKTTVFNYFIDGYFQIVQNVAIRQGEGWSIHWLGVPPALQILLMGWLPVLGIVWAGEKLIRLQGNANRPSYRMLLFLFLHALAMTVSTVSYSYSIHIGLVSWTGYLLAFMAMQDMLRKTSPLWKKGVVAFAVLFLAAISATYCLYAIEALTNANLRVASYGTTESSFVAFQDRQKTLALGIVVESIRQAVPPEQPIFVFNTSPNVYFLADRRPVGRFLWILPVLMSQEQRHELARTLRQAPPPLVVYDHTDEKLMRSDPRFRAYRESPPRLTELFEFLGSRYESVPVNQDFTVYKLKPGGQTAAEQNTTNNSSF